jgi:hypothetical protein
MYKTSEQITAELLEFFEEEIRKNINTEEGFRCWFTFKRKELKPNKELFLALKIMENDYDYYVEFMDTDSTSKNGEDNIIVFICPFWLYLQFEFGTQLIENQLNMMEEVYDTEEDCYLEED